MVLDPEERGTTRGPRARSLGGWSGRRRLSTETKHATKTTEFWVFLAVLAGILIAAALIGADDDAGRGDNFGDYFTADDAWRYITALTIGYLLSRGLAKSGSREPYWEGGSNEERGDREGGSEAGSTTLR